MHSHAWLSDRVFVHKSLSDLCPCRADRLRPTPPLQPSLKSCSACIHACMHQPVLPLNLCACSTSHWAPSWATCITSPTVCACLHPQVPSLKLCGPPNDLGSMAASMAMGVAKTITTCPVLVVKHNTVGVGRYCL